MTCVETSGTGFQELDWVTVPGGAELSKAAPCISDHIARVRMGG